MSGGLFHYRRSGRKLRPIKTRSLAGLCGVLCLVSEFVGGAPLQAIAAPTPWTVNQLVQRLSNAATLPYHAREVLISAIRNDPRAPLAIRQEAVVQLLRNNGITSGAELGKYVGNIADVYAASRAAQEDAVTGPSLVMPGFLEEQTAETTAASETISAQPAAAGGAPVATPTPMLFAAPAGDFDPTTVAIGNADLLGQYIVAYSQPNPRHEVIEAAAERLFGRYGLAAFRSDVTIADVRSFAKLTKEQIAGETADVLALERRVMQPEVLNSLDSKLKGEIESEHAVLASLVTADRQVLANAGESELHQRLADAEALARRGASMSAGLDPGTYVGSLLTASVGLVRDKGVDVDNSLDNALETALTDFNNKAPGLVTKIGQAEALLGSGGIADLAKEPLLEVLANHLSGGELISSGEIAQLRDDPTVASVLSKVGLAGGADDLEALASEEQSFSQKADDYVSSVSDIVSSAKSIFAVAGITLPSDVENVMNVAETATSAISDVLTGNFLGAVMSFGGLFGGGPSQAQIYQQQIMDQFKTVEAELNKVEHLQIQTLEAVEKVSQQVAQLTDIVQKYHAEEMAEFYKIEYKEDFIVGFLTQKASADYYGSCQHFMDGWAKPTYVGLSTDPDSPWNPDLFAPCLTALAQIAQKPDNGAVNPILYATPPPGSADIAQHSFDQNFLSAFRSSSAQDMSAFTVLPKDIWQVVDLGGPPQDVARSQYQPDINNTWGTPQSPTLLILPGEVLNYDRWLIATLAYCGLVKDDGAGRFSKLVSVDDLSAKPSLAQGCNRADSFGRAISLTSAVIGQEAGLSGSWLLKNVHDQYATSPDSVLQFLSGNDVLASNFVLYMVAQAVKSPSNVPQYALAYSSGSVSQMQQFVNTPLNDVQLNYDGNIWTVTFLRPSCGNAPCPSIANLPVPTADQLLSGFLRPRADLPALLEARRQLMTEVALDDFDRRLSVGQREVLTALLLGP